jgi:hypothetical protein
MHHTIIQKLFASFTDLELAIKSARQTLAQKESVPANVFIRLNNYEEILEKQKLMAMELVRYLEMGNMEEVSKIVSKINALSQMIRDDAKEVLSSITNTPVQANLDDDDSEEVDPDVYMC